MKNLQLGIAHLSRDPVIRALVVRYGILDYQPPADRFANLVESIVSQQLSPKASDTIFARLQSRVIRISPENILRISDLDIRNCGLSWAKVRSLQDLSQKVIAKLVELPKLDQLSDEEVIAHLTQVKGIGRWTAQMKLMFALHRPDILPLGDVGIQRAFERLYKVQRGDFKKMTKIASKWQPYRTLACWYLWKSLDNA